MTVNRYSKKNIFLSYITILRLVNGVVAGFAATFGIVLSLPDSLPEGKDPNYLSISLVVLTTMFVSSQAMIFNDIIDRDVDAINAPHRPIPTGKISLKSAKIYGCIVALLALGTAVAMDVMYDLYGISVITVIIFGGSLDLYNIKFKKMGFFGNTIIGLNVIALFAYGTLHTYLIYGTFAWVPIVVGVAAGSGNIGREVIKGLPDIEGDRESGVRTLAVKYGPRKTAIIGSAFLLVLVIGGSVAAIRGNLYYPSMIIVFLIVALVLYLIVRIIIDQNPKWAYTTKEILLLVFLAFLLTFIIDKIVRLALT